MNGEAQDGGAGLAFEHSEAFCEAARGRGVQRAIELCEAVQDQLDARGVTAPRRTMEVVSELSSVAGSILGWLAVFDGWCTKRGLPGFDVERIVEATKSKVVESGVDLDGIFRPDDEDWPPASCGIDCCEESALWRIGALVEVDGETECATTDYGLCQEHEHKLGELIWDVADRLRSALRAAHQTEAIAIRRVILIPGSLSRGEVIALSDEEILQFEGVDLEGEP